MNIEELSAAKDETARIITAALNRFHEHTGYRISKINIYTSSANWDGGSCPPEPIYEAHCVVEL